MTVKAAWFIRYDEQWDENAYPTSPWTIVESTGAVFSLPTYISFSPRLLQRGRDQVSYSCRWICHWTSRIIFPKWTEQPARARARTQWRGAKRAGRAMQYRNSEGPGFLYLRLYTKEEEPARRREQRDVCKRRSIRCRSRQWSWNHRPYPAVDRHVFPGNRRMVALPTNAMLNRRVPQRFSQFFLILFGLALFFSGSQSLNFLEVARILPGPSTLRLYPFYYFHLLLVPIYLLHTCNKKVWVLPRFRALYSIAALKP